MQRHDFKFCSTSRKKVFGPPSSCCRQSQRMSAWKLFCEIFSQKINGIILAPPCPPTAVRGLRVFGYAMMVTLIIHFIKIMRRRELGVWQEDGHSVTGLCAPTHINLSSRDTSVSLHHKFSGICRSRSVTVTGPSKRNWRSRICYRSGPNAPKEVTLSVSAYSKCLRRILITNNNDQCGARSRKNVLLWKAHVSLAVGSWLAVACPTKWIVKDARGFEWGGYGQFGERRGLDQLGPDWKRLRWKYEIQKGFRGWPVYISQYNIIHMFCVEKTNMTAVAVVASWYFRLRVY